MGDSLGRQSPTFLIFAHICTKCTNLFHIGFCTDTRIEDVDVFQNFLVLYERHDGIPRIRIADRRVSTELGSLAQLRTIGLPDDHKVGVISPGANKDFCSSVVRFSASTPLIPKIIYDYDMEHGKPELLYFARAPHRIGRTLLNGDSDRDSVTTNRHFARSTGIPGATVSKAQGKVCTPGFLPGRLSL